MITLHSCWLKNRSKEVMHLTLIRQMKVTHQMRLTRHTCHLNPSLEIAPPPRGPQATAVLHRPPPPHATLHLCTMTPPLAAAATATATKAMHLMTGAPCLTNPKRVVTARATALPTRSNLLTRLVAIPTVAPAILCTPLTRLLTTPATTPATLCTPHNRLLTIPTTHPAIHHTPLHSLAMAMNTTPATRSTPLTSITTLVTVLATPKARHNKVDIMQATAKGLLNSQAGVRSAVYASGGSGLNKRLESEFVVIPAHAVTGSDLLTLTCSPFSSGFPCYSSRGPNKRDDFLFFWNVV